MSTEAQHLALANRNQHVLDHLLQDVDGCTEWVVTVAFYKALHIVEAIFANDLGIVHTFKHEARLDALKSQRRYQLLHKQFRALWGASTVARYLADQGRAGRAYTCFSDYLDPKEVREKVLDYYLVPLENQAIQLLSPEAKTVLHLYRPLPKP